MREKRDSDKKGDKIVKILFAVCIIPLVVGIFLIQTENTEYSTREYWVAQDHRHVYERYSGQIVNVIEENETCTIKGNKIVVKKRGGAYGFGMFLVVFFGMCTAGAVIGAIGTSDWWLEFKEKMNW